MAVQRNPSTMATIGSGESVLIREVNYTMLELCLGKEKVSLCIREVSLFQSTF